MNLFLKPLNDVNDVTWSIVWCMIILLVGVGYYIYTIMNTSYQEMGNGSNDSTEQEELLQLSSSRD
jgi:hypothetical protein